MPPETRHLTAATRGCQIARVITCRAGATDDTDNTEKKNAGRGVVPRPALPCLRVIRVIRVPCIVLICGSVAVART